MGNVDIGQSTGMSNTVGVGLRHPHYEDVLSKPADIDFVEVHAENFYMDGGPALSLLHDVREVYGVSVHATTLGPGSMSGIPDGAIARLARLVREIDPMMVSDHAAFTWAGQSTVLEHGGDLLPISFNETVLDQFIENVHRVQQAIGRPLWIENLSSYLTMPDNKMQEYEFLQQVCEATGSGLLLDLNNLYVNAFNARSPDALDEIRRIVDAISPEYVGEIHLAGCAPPAVGEPMVDDHSTEVPDTVWRAYEYACRKIGPRPTLIEWDNDIPGWSALTREAAKASLCQAEVAGREFF